MPEKPAHRDLGLGREILVIQRQPAGRVLLRHGPDDRRAVTKCVVVHRQQRERAGRVEDLVSDMFMRTLVPEHRDDSLMIVFPAGDVDTGRFARL